MRILKILQERNVPHAVVFSNTFLKRGEEAHGVDGCVVIPNEFKDVKSEFKFTHTHETHKKVAEKEMTSAQIKEFKESHDGYDVHISGEFGSVYEFNKLSLFKYLK